MRMMESVCPHKPAYQINVGSITLDQNDPTCWRIGYQVSQVGIVVRGMAIMTTRLLIGCVIKTTQVYQVKLGRDLSLHHNTRESYNRGSRCSGTQVGVS